MSKLSIAQVELYLNKLPHWKFENNSLSKTYKRKDFNDSIAFVLSIAELVAEGSHHPDLLIQYDRVTVMLTTHDSGGVTGKDFSLAQLIESTVKK